MKYHTVQCYYWHPVYLASRTLKIPFHHSDRHFEKTVMYAKLRDVTVLSHNEWNIFWRGRERVRYLKITWNGKLNSLRFWVGNGAVRGLTFIVPLVHNGLEAVVMVEESKVHFKKCRINDRWYAMFPLDVAGKPVKVEVNYR